MITYFEHLNEVYQHMKQQTVKNNEEYNLSVD